MSDKKQELPPPNLTTLVSMLGTQVLVSLGQIPNPVTNKAEVELDQASHGIEMLAMIEQKTTGNRTDEESQMLEMVLHQLRMMFVQAKK